MRAPVPFVQEAVFLSAPDLRCEFDDVQKIMVFGRDGLEKQTGLPGIWNGLLARAPRSERDRVNLAFARRLDDIRDKIGVAGMRKHRTVDPRTQEFLADLLDAQAS